MASSRASTPTDTSSPPPAADADSVLVAAANSLSEGERLLQEMARSETSGACSRTHGSSGGPVGAAAAAAAAAAASAAAGENISCAGQSGSNSTGLSLISSGSVRVLLIDCQSAHAGVGAHLLPVALRAARSLPCWPWLCAPRCSRLARQGWC